VKRTEIFCPLIILLVLIFYLLTIRAGHPWGDDFAMYVHEAKNLSERVPLSDTGYIYNPYRPVVGPRLYPPVFPLLLVPGYLMGGLNHLTPMKVEMVLFFVSTLIVIWRGLGADLPPPQRAAMLAVLGLNPQLWSYKDFILSDILFTLLLYLMLAQAHRLMGEQGSARERVWRIVGLAGLVYLCYGTRTIGIVLIPVLFLLALAHWKRGGRSIVWAAALALVLCSIQRWLLGADASYLDQLDFHVPKLVKGVFLNVQTYGWSLSTFWENPYTKIVRDILLISTSFFALLAYVRRIRGGPRIYEIFLPFYLAVVLLWPNSAGGVRYLIPIFPLYVYYFLEGVATLKGRLQVRQAEPILVPLLALVFLSYGAEFAHLDFGPFREGIAKEASVQLFSFVRSGTNVKDVFIFAKPRALGLYTGRSASIYPHLQNTAEVCRYAHSVGATYFIEAPALDDPRFDAFLTRESPAKQLVFSNSDFRVFHVLPPDLAKCSGEQQLSDTLRR
jgi:hypothetical protein